MSELLNQRLRRHLAALHAEGLARELPQIGQRDGVRYQLDGAWVTGFCSNDYLGLANHPRLRPSNFATLASGDAAGATASRLVAGDLPAHRAAEQALAALAGSDDAVLFPSGFQLNVGVLPALIEPDDTVFSDALNHASLIDGLRLARARPTILPHRTAPPPIATPRWWVTESIFSMDGDTAEPARLREFSERGGMLYLDEAHSLGLFPGGAGFARHHGIRTSVLMGGLGKAFGLAGAFAAGSREVCTWIRTRARSFVFSTGNPPALAEQARLAATLLTGPDGDERRARLWNNARLLAAALERTPPVSPIFPVLIGANQLAVTISHALRERGWHVQAIRPPTVPVGTARLRLTVTADHDEAQIHGLVADLRTLLQRHGLSLADTQPLTDPR
ncbi:aminotransferase class I/II-fold pyridoxal phosphate-dependent enzyme [Nannocystis bainbridge]|uniref:Aminotransferase class I/II-fold pyridoxal phosphate-dependent enzyme n=1 Tax=Nannocystis bainbridge TaxID=2995303 RepID=A0ABT5DY99_9BACT|nr:aminotransferase class I/II-fold pyridoxal phosphate-dependent enzyme [Nannocystis bainbridge]MDC0718602.1 aminotransferase class I/II-fold pyridoxal phosphate-dependent enzyme [Nannocystis bainbridge]